MDPVTVALLLASTLGGAFIKDNSADDAIKRAQQLFSPGAINRSTGEFYRNFIGSPAFADAQRGVLRGSNRLAANVSASLGARGLDSTGVGAISSGLANSAGSFKMGSLYSDAWSQAMESAFRSASGVAGAAGSMPQPRFGTPEVFGAGLDALTKYVLMQSMRSTPGSDSPTFAGGGNGNAGPTLQDIIKMLQGMI